MADKKPEVWLRGSVAGIIPQLQPVVHALLQVKEELNNLLQNFKNEHLWVKPFGMASAGFHLQHLQGVLERLFTYAQSENLSATQLQKLSEEGKENPLLTVQDLVSAFNQQVEVAFHQLQNTSTNDLLQTRGVGRNQLPSNVAGLYFHAAEHSMRHLGQLLVTVTVVNNSRFATPT